MLILFENLSILPRRYGILFGIFLFYRGVMEFYLESFYSTAALWNFIWNLSILPRRYGILFGIFLFYRGVMEFYLESFYSTEALWNFIWNLSILLRRYGILFGIFLFYRGVMEFFQITLFSRRYMFIRFCISMNLIVFFCSINLLYYYFQAEKPY